MTAPLDCDHRFFRLAASPWTPSEGGPTYGRVYEERQEIIACRRCGHMDAMTHEKPIDSRRWGDGGHSFINR